VNEVPDLISNRSSSPLVLPNTDEKRALVVIAHADDLLFFCGSTVFHLINSGWNVEVIRVTDDRWDSANLSEEETLLLNKSEFDQAMASVGVSRIHEFGYQTDLLGDNSEVELRQKVMSIIRSFKPYLVLSFDPDSIINEDNEDHKLVARAVTESMWTSGFDKHPDSGSTSIAPHIPIERWYFGRRVVQVTHYLEISPYREKLENALACHITMLKNIFMQFSIQADFMGFDLKALGDLLDKNPREFVALLLQERTRDDLRIVKSVKLVNLINSYGVKK
jgi:LmbE family N-acetylglucosaminyl deacetylase